ncbi:MAG TPA: hypothetical protein GXZ50_03190 [Clostridia bacterium]|nr:hypothetical protein [Clostridia bacterium]
MKAGRKLLGMSIISLESGEQIGSVKGYIINPKTIQIAAVVLEKRGGWFKDSRVITFDNIKNVGEHAITVEITKCIEKASTLPEIMALSKQDINLTGAKVISGDGNLLGTVEEFYFEPTSGKITAIEITGRLFDTLFKGKAMLDTLYIKTLGKHAIIVTSEAEKNLKRQESSLSETVKNVKEKSNKVWNSTIETTKRLGEAISKSVEKFTDEEGEISEIKEQPLPEDLPEEVHNPKDT